MRFFNTEGPVNRDDHYAIPPLARLDVDGLLGLIRTKRYFVLHAPRQTGKTSALIALRDLLNGGRAGNFRCVNVNVEVGQAAGDDTDRAMPAILGNLADCARLLGDDFPDSAWRTQLATLGPDGALKGLCSGRWCEANPTPLVLLIDEIDSLVGATLLSVLRQLRSGYELRPRGFPQSVVLCGVRDIRDYRIRSTAGEGDRRRQSVQRGREVPALGRFHRGADTGFDSRSTRRKPGSALRRRRWTRCGGRPKANRGS